MTHRAPKTANRPPEQLPLDFDFSSARAAPLEPEARPTRETSRAALVLRELRASAKEWWYHTDLRRQGHIEEARQLERAAVRSMLGEIRATLANDGWLQIGRGGATLHYSPNAHVEGLHPHHIRACIAAGIPTLDSTGMKVEDVYELAVRGPMPGFVDETFGTDPDGSLSKRHWRVIFDRYAARDGAVFHNYSPTPSAWRARSSSPNGDEPARAPETASTAPLEGETVSAFEAKQERRRQRLLDRAERQEALAESSQAAAQEIADGIPMGQPILVGHHSERGDRRRRERMQTLYQRAHEARETADELHRRAQAVGTAGISGDDPKATGKLEAKASELEAKREVMKRANAYWRAHKSLKDFDELDPKEKTEALRTMLLTGAEVPFPGWALRNIGARIRQAKARVEEIAARDEAEPQELQGRGFRVFEDRDDNRLLIEFEERQPPETCRMLHQAGFRWARSRGAWSRQLTNAAWASAHYVARILAEDSLPTPETPDSAS